VVPVITNKNVDSDNVDVDMQMNVDGSKHINIRIFGIVIYGYLDILM